VTEDYNSIGIIAQHKKKMDFLSSSLIFGLSSNFTPDNYYSEVIDVTEDVIFCEKVKKAGFSIAVDPKIQCGHLNVEIKTQLDYDAYLQQYHDYQKLIDKFGDGTVNIDG